MAAERERTDQIKHGASGGMQVTARGNPNGLFGFCCGIGLPVVDEIPEGGRGSYTTCPIWRGEKDRIEAGRKGHVFKPKERGSVTPFGLPVPGDQTPGSEAMDPERIREIAREMARG